VKSPEVQARFGPDGTLAIGSTPAEFAEFIKLEQARWSAVVKQAAIKAE
jgi:tripartite-type tricarboxylate transporter receptor subunit TctC